MNNDIIIQTMTEAFETLKDSWGTKKDSIIKCIVETEACDGALAMDMWTYILKKNESLHRDKSDNVHLVDDVILCFNEKYETDKYNYCLSKTILEHIAPHIINNENLIKLIFGHLCNAGYSNIDYGFSGNPSEPIPILLASIFMQDSPQIIPILVNALSHNKLVEDIRVGELILKSNYYLDGIETKWTWKIGDGYHVSDQVKESLLSCIDLIHDNEDRAEIALSLMAR